VEEDPSFLELVRYSHLNPIRAGTVREISDLDNYPYSGHSVIMGSQKLKPQDVPGVLEFFGKWMRAARKEYRLFAAGGIEKGVREDLRGGACAGFLTPR
jgi:putative transposase